MRIRIENSFHLSEAIVTVKDKYVEHTDWGLSLTPLEYILLDTESDATDRTYAHRKLQEIKSKVCGHKDCTCDGFNRYLPV